MIRSVRPIIRIDEALCNGCGQCVTGCAEGALRIVDGKARLVSDIYCDGLGACLGQCPTGALTLADREAEPFDQHAVEEMLARQQPLGHDTALCAGPSPDGCPSAAPLTLFPRAGAPLSPCAMEDGPSLGHWPIQIRLVPPRAPFLQGSRLLVAADCAPAAAPAIHARHMDGRAVLIGCPKFDDAMAYADRFAAIFSENDIQDVTVLEMEVPCCAGLHRIVLEGLRRSGRNVPVERVTVSRDGRVLERTRV